MSTAKAFSIKEAFGWGFNAIISNIVPVLILTFISLIIPTIRTIIVWRTQYQVEQGYTVSPELVISFFALSFLNWFVTTFVLVALLRLSLSFYNTKQPVSFRSLFTVPLTYCYLILAQVLYSFITFGGLLLLIIPGIIWAVMYNFFDIIIIESKCGPIKALKKSRALTKGFRWRLALFYLIVFAFAILAVFTIIGIPLILPIISATRVYIFKKLQEKNSGPKEKEYVPPIMTS